MTCAKWTENSTIPRASAFRMNAEARIAPLRLQIPVREYLSAVLPGLEDFPANRVNELTPVAWFARKS